MATLQFKNNAQTTLSGSINDSQTSISVDSSSSFPVVNGTGDYFYATMYEDSGGTEINIEIVKVTETVGTTWTVVRAQDGTTARARNGLTTVYIELRLTAASASLMLQSGNNLSDLANAGTARTNLGLGSIATQAANNVAITGGSISGVSFESLDSTTTIKDNADPTKAVQFQVSGVTTATTRTLTVPDASGTIALTSDLSSYQPLDSDLTAVAGLSANGLIARTSTGAMAVRTISQPAAGITVTNGDGVSGNPTIALANDLSAVEGISTTGFVKRTASDTWTAASIADGDLPSALTGKTYNALTLTSNATGFSVAGGTTSKTLTVNNTLGLSGTDSSTLDIGTGGTLGTGAYATIANYAALGSGNTFTSAQTFRAANAVRSEAASTQDAVVLAGRAGGTSSYAVTITPTTLAGNRTVTLPDASTTIPVISQVLTISGPTAARTYTLPDASTTLVGTTDTQTLSNKTITGTKETVYAISDGAAFEIDPANGGIQTITLGASRTPKATNFTAGQSVTLMVDDGTAYTLTWTDATFGGSGVVWKTDSGSAPTLNTTGYTVIVLWKISTQVYGARVGNA